MQKILFQVLSSIRPSDEEIQKELAIADELISKFQSSAPSGSEVILTGSVAKRTFLKEGRDIDIFVLFDRSYPREMLEMLIKNVMESSLPGTGYQISYAEHPYVRFHYRGRRIDLVPAYKISDSSERLSAVDRSALHTIFVNSHLPKQHIGDVLLLKAFLKANSLYGAEIKIKGFSGYLCELLVIRYGSFPELVRQVSRWNPSKPMLIDLKGFHKGKQAVTDAHGRLGAFVVIDPTDKNRNVAAALSMENLRAFIALCKSFLKKPTALYFTRKPETFDEKCKRLASAKGAKVFIITMPRSDVVDDILWGQLYRLNSQLESHMADFSPKAIIADDSRHIVRIALSLSKDTLPCDMAIAGPPLDMKKNVIDFRKKHKGARFFKQKKRMMAKVKRQITSAHDAIMEFFRSFSRTKSHLACSEELVVVERYAEKTKQTSVKTTKAKTKKIKAKNARANKKNKIKRRK